MLVVPPGALNVVIQRLCSSSFEVEWGPIACINTEELHSFQKILASGAFYDEGIVVP
jgi:hypothetical protein